MTASPRRALVTGATGFIGGRLAAALADDRQVRCLVRDRSRARALAERGLELFEGDVLNAGSLRGAGEGVAPWRSRSSAIFVFPPSNAPS